jgi:hypothetical protein
MEGTHMNAIARGGLAAFFATSFLAGMAHAQAPAPCVALDQAVTGKLKPLIERTDMHSTVLSGAVVRDLAWARLDCREGRYARAEANYRVLIDALDRNPTAEQVASRAPSVPDVAER